MVSESSWVLPSGSLIIALALELRRMTAPVTGKSSSGERPMYRKVDCYGRRKGLECRCGMLCTKGCQILEGPPSLACDLKTQRPWTRTSSNTTMEGRLLVLGWTDGTLTAGFLVRFCLATKSSARMERAMAMSTPCSAAVAPQASRLQLSPSSYSGLPPVRPNVALIQPWRDSGQLNSQHHLLFITNAFDLHKL